MSEDKHLHPVGQLDVDDMIRKPYGNRRTRMRRISRSGTPGTGEPSRGLRSMRAKARSTIRTKSRPSPGRWPSYHVDAAVNSASASFPIRRGRFNGSADRARGVPEPRARAHRGQRPSGHGPPVGTSRTPGCARGSNKSSSTWDTSLRYSVPRRSFWRSEPSCVILSSKRCAERGRRTALSSGTTSIKSLMISGVAKTRESSRWSGVVLVRQPGADRARSEPPNFAMHRTGRSAARR